MATTTDLITKINENYGKMSKGQKLLANYIIDNYDKAVFLTAAKLGDIIGVSESTVVRFASFIGYKGYPEFQQALEEMVRTKLNSSDRIEITNGGIEQNGVLRTVLSADALKIKNTMESIDEAAFENAVEAILNARRIYIVGIRTCAPLASFLSFYLNMIFDNVVNLQTSSTSELFEQMIHINKEDCIIGISFPRYSMRTLKALEFANNRLANVITITDSIHSPMNLYSSCNLIAESDMHAVVDSLVAPLSVINALIVELCARRQSVVAQNLEMIENVWNDYQFYENDEIDLVDDSIKMSYPGEI
ncbi:MAG: MurR/RpiR family transcriptional regulator [Pseudobutyrivibrio sp.]|nr:MurR/RpiR family transcriptional regulator [Pseudobutyrivibrio sp.]